MVGEGGFEPPKSLTTDLQSAPFGHSGIPPNIQLFRFSLAAQTSEAFATRKRRKAGTVRASFDVELVDGLEPPTC